VEEEMFFGGDLFAKPFKGFAGTALLGEEAHAHPERAIFRGRVSDSRKQFTEEKPVALEKKAGAVAGGFITSCGSAMQEILEDGQALFDQEVGSASLEIGEKTDPTPVMFILRIVKASLAGFIHCSLNP